MSKFRGEGLIDQLTDQSSSILKNLYIPTELKISMRRKDLRNRNALYYMESMDAFELMNTKVMDRIMKEYWNSNIDTSGSFFQASTCYQLLQDLKHEDQDPELATRFYLKRDIREFSQHSFTMRVYLKSMQTRYFIELLLFLILAIVF